MKQVEVPDGNPISDGTTPYLKKTLSETSRAIGGTEKDAVSVKHLKISKLKAGSLISRNEKELISDIRDFMGSML